jgi:hypothetical protein
MISKFLAVAASGYSAANAFSYVPEAGTYQIYVDNSTYANADMIATSHFHVNWDVNFEAKALEGYVIHDLNVLVDTDFLTLDSWNNNINKIEKVPNGSAFA